MGEKNLFSTFFAAQIILYIGSDFRHFSALPKFHFRYSVDKKPPAYSQKFQKKEKLWWKAESKVLY